MNRAALSVSDVFEKAHGARFLWAATSGWELLLVLVRAQLQQTPQLPEEVAPTCAASSSPRASQGLCVLAETRRAGVQMHSDISLWFSLVFSR